MTSGSARPSPFERIMRKASLEFPIANMDEARRNRLKPGKRSRYLKSNRRIPFSAAGGGGVSLRKNTSINIDIPAGINAMRNIGLMSSLNAAKNHIASMGPMQAPTESMA